MATLTLNIFIFTDILMFTDLLTEEKLKQYLSWGQKQNLKLPYLKAKISLNKSWLLLGDVHKIINCLVTMNRIFHFKAEEIKLRIKRGLIS